MEINILHLLEGAQQARGLTVIIDVFRAFSTACYAFEAGAKKIRPVGLIDEAYKLKDLNPDYVLMGERNEIKPQGFDLGNSPSQIPVAGFSGRTVVHTTSSGTQGIVAATNATEILTGSFVNAGSIVDYIQSRKPKQVSLVCMGYACKYTTDEDTLCAEYLRNQLKGQSSDFNEMTMQIRNGSGKRFFEENKQEWAPKQDFDLCLSLNRFNFVLKVERDTYGQFLRKINPPFHTI